ncbi:MAG: hypothetical protein HYV35_05450, partial [Lentisphaerae bacterium]|nr:hypothetical protein [Lentisphaerota bacterium]
FVLKDGSTYKMWYTGHDTYSIYYATSSNGLEWTKYDNTVPALSDGICTNGKIPHGNAGRGDASYTWYPAVIKDGSTNKMWYSGYFGGVYTIFYATSTNGGLTWTKYDNTIPAISDDSSTNGKIPMGSSGRGDSTYVLTPSVIKDDGIYKMWYTGNGGGTICVYYATSSNGLEWTKYDNGIPDNSDGSSTNGKVPRGSSGKGDSLSASTPCVIKVGSAYKMWYVGSDAGNTARVYHATSSNGLEWTKLDNSIPLVSDTTNSNSRLGLGTAGKGDSKYASHPKVVIANDRWNSYQMWYSGYDGANWRVYHAISPPPAGTIFTFR